MPEVTASTKIVLGSVAAAAALITGLLGNVLAANISAFFSGQPPKTGKRPVILWLAFFVSASLSVVAGSITTFAPTAPSTATAPGSTPKVVVTNINGVLAAQNERNLFIICRDTVELANTSDVPTSIVAVGTELNVDGTVVNIDPNEYGGSGSAGDVSASVKPWKTGPDLRLYGRVRSLELFGAVSGGPLPIRSDARSTVSVFIDYALKLTTAMPQSISAVHVLKFPDVEDVKTESIRCQ
jgi:hypothetical protein